jgi:hypothetical protein
MQGLFPALVQPEQFLNPVIGFLDTPLDKADPFLNPGHLTVGFFWAFHGS